MDIKRDMEMRNKRFRVRPECWDYMTGGKDIGYTVDELVITWGEVMGMAQDQGRPAEEIRAKLIEIPPDESRMATGRNR
jgi:hypothetical protein